MNYTLHLGDCLEYMQEMKSQSVDVVVTDPPYGVELDYDIYNDTLENWRALFLELVPELKRIAKMAILPSCQINQLPFIYANHPPDWIIAWHKGSPGTQSYIGFNDWEPLLVYGKTDGICMHDFLSVTNIERKGNYGHPCPKPERWATWLISRSSQEGNTIFDPFMGSGTTGVAAVKLNRQFIGCELSPKYYAIAESRIAQAALQPGLFTASNKRLHSDRATPEGKQAQLFNINSGKQSPENKTTGR